MTFVVFIDIRLHIIDFSLHLIEFLNFNMNFFSKLEVIRTPNLNTYGNLRQCLQQRRNYSYF